MQSSDENDNFLEEEDKTNDGNDQPFIYLLTSVEIRSIINGSNRLAKVAPKP